MCCALGERGGGIAVLRRRRMSEAAAFATAETCRAVDARPQPLGDQACRVVRALHFGASLSLPQFHCIVLSGSMHPAAKHISVPHHDRDAMVKASATISSSLTLAPRAAA